MEEFVDEFWEFNPDNIIQSFENKTVGFQLQFYPNENSNCLDNKDLLTYLEHASVNDLVQSSARYYEDCNRSLYYLIPISYPLMYINIVYKYLKEKNIKLNKAFDLIFIEIDSQNGCIIKIYKAEITKNKVEFTKKSLQELF